MALFPLTGVLRRFLACGVLLCTPRPKSLCGLGHRQNFSFMIRKLSKKLACDNFYFLKQILPGVDQKTDKDDVWP
jgi:hypothetical protein